jgi:hypothetical protein
MLRVVTDDAFGSDYGRSLLRPIGLMAASILITFSMLLTSSLIDWHRTQPHPLGILWFIVQHTFSSFSSIWWEYEADNFFDHTSIQCVFSIKLQVLVQSMVTIVSLALFLVHSNESLSSEVE